MHGDGDPRTGTPLCLDCYDHAGAGRLERVRSEALDPHHRRGQTRAAPPLALTAARRPGSATPRSRSSKPAAPCTCTPCSASTAATPPTRTRSCRPPQLGHRRAAEPPPGRRRPLDGHPDAGPSRPAGRLGDPVGRTGPPAHRRPRAARRRGHRAARRRLPRQVRHQSHRGRRPPLDPAHRVHRPALRRPGQPHRPADRRRLEPRPTGRRPPLVPALGSPWAHMLGFGGHFATKSRAYSTTFGALRAARSTAMRRANATAARPTPAHRRRDRTPCSSSAPGHTPAPAGVPPPTLPSPSPPLTPLGHARPAATDSRRLTRKEDSTVDTIHRTSVVGRRHLRVPRRPGRRPCTSGGTSEPAPRPTGSGGGCGTTRPRSSPGSSGTRPDGQRPEAAGRQVACPVPRPVRPGTRPALRSQARRPTLGRPPRDRARPVGSGSTRPFRARPWVPGPRSGWADRSSSSRRPVRRYAAVLRVQVPADRERVPLKAVTHTDVPAGSPSSVADGLSPRLRYTRRTGCSLISSTWRSGTVDCPATRRPGFGFPARPAPSSGSSTAAEVAALAGRVWSLSAAGPCSAYCGLRLGEAAGLRVRRRRPDRRRLAGRAVGQRCRRTAGRRPLRRQHHARESRAARSWRRCCRTSWSARAADDPLFTGPGGGRCGATTSGGALRPRGRRGRPVRC